MKQKNFTKRMAALIMAFVLAAGSAVRPEWCASAADQEIECIDTETTNTEEGIVGEAEDHLEEIIQIQEPQTQEPAETEKISAMPRETEKGTIEENPLMILEQEVVSGVPEKTEEETVPSGPEKPGTETTGAAPEETEAQTVPAVPEETEAQTAPAAPEETEAQTTSAVPEETEAQTAPVAPEEAETQTAPAAPEETETQTAPAAPEETETQIMSAESEETGVETVPEVLDETETGREPEDETGGIIIPETEMAKETESEPDTMSDPDIESDFLKETEQDVLYALLYESGELVFQRGKIPDPDKGDVIEEMTGFEELASADKYSWPWYSDWRKSVRKVSFKEKYSPLTTAGMFYGCENLVSFDSRNFDVSSVKDMDYMFSNCSSLRVLDIKDWDMRRTETMKGIFEACRFDRLVLGPVCRLAPGALPDDTWSRDSSGEEYTSETLCKTYDGTAMAGIYYSQTAAASEENEESAETDSVQNYINAAGKVKVVFDTQGGEPMDPLELEPGEVFGGTVSEKIPSRESFTFLGWHTGSPDGPLVGKSDCAGQEDIVLFAEWKRNPVITYDTNGSGLGISKKQIRYGGKVGTLPKCPSNENWGGVLTGWFTKAEGGEEVQSDWIVYEDVTYYAHWGWKPCFDADGGVFTNFPEYPVQESREYLISALPEVKRDGCTLTGWFLSDGVTQVRAGETVDLSRGIEITAHWEMLGKVKLILDPSPWDNAFYVSGKTTLEVYQGQPVIMLTDPKYSPGGGRRFLGWFDKEGVQWTKDTVITEDTELHAAWSETAVEVKFDADGGTGLTHSTLTLPSGSAINVLPGARKTNYILEGWYTEKDGAGEKLTTDTVITKETVYYAHWIPFFMNASDQTAAYVYGAEWRNASNANVDVTGDNLIVHPSDRQDQTAQLHIRFEMNVSVGDFVLPEKAVKITIPKYVWKDWEGRDTGTNNLSVNLPEYPDNRSGMFFSYIDEGDHYLLVNNQKLSGGTGVDVTVSYKVNPVDVPGGAMDADGQYLDEYDYYKGTAEVTFCVDADQDGTPETAENKELFLEMHTRISNTSVKEFRYVYYRWQKDWGNPPSDADDYFYVKWELRPYFSQKTNQPGTYEWTEDGLVHDGTVVFLRTPDNVVSSSEYASTVVLRYPMELLKNSSTSGLLLHNEALLTVNWKSGYKTYQRVQADGRVYMDKYPVGEFGKERPYYSPGESSQKKLIAGGQEKLVEDEQDVNMKWNIEYNGGSKEIPVWDEKTGTYITPDRTIRIRDGLSKDLLYSSGRSADKYVWEPDTGNVVLSDDDYSFTELKVTVTEYDAECRDGVWLSKTRHYEQDDVKGVDIYVRYKGSGKLSYWTSIPGTNLGSEKTIFFPQGVVGFEFRHGTSFYWTIVSLKLSVNIHPTEAVKALVSSDMEEGTTSLIKNKAFCDVWETESGEESIYFSSTNYAGGKNWASKEIWELNMSQTTQYACKQASGVDNVVLDVDRGTQDNPIYISGWNYNSLGKEKQLRKGILYDLLPAGATVDVSSLFGFALTGNSRAEPQKIGKRADLYDRYKEKTGKLTASNYDVRFTDDWEKSGRTMMTVTFTLPDSPDITGVEFFYLLHNTYENILLHGTTVENDLAFVNTSDNRVRPASLVGKQSLIEDSYLYDGLQEQHEGFIAYAEASVNYVPVDAYSWGFEKSVKTYSDYRPKGEVFPGTSYTYKLSYSQSEYAESSGIVFYDLLEEGYFIQDDSGQQKMESQWRGTFAGVDVREAAQKLTGGSDTVRCSPVVWYATKDRESFTKADYDLSRTDVWSIEPPKDLAAVTAVAVDCRKNTEETEFVLLGRQVMDIYINMRAPENVPKDALYTYNEGSVFAKQKSDEEPTELTSDALVEIIAGEPELHKESDPPTGTEKEPAQLKPDETLEYTLSVTNSGTVRTMTDIVVEDTVPDGLEIASSEIMVRFSGTEEALKVSESPRISMTESGQYLKFVISTLFAGETAYITIPCKVLLEEGLLVNTAHVTSVDGVKKEVTSETTYHEVVPRSTLRIKKTVQGSLGDKFYPFSFRLKFTAENQELPEEWNCKKGDAEFTIKPNEDGYLIFTLSDGEVIEFPNIPRGTRYEVAESDGTSMGYEVKAENDSGTVDNEDIQVSFVNIKDGFVPTGIGNSLYGCLALTLAAAAALALAVFRKRLQR